MLKFYFKLWTFSGNFIKQIWCSMYLLKLCICFFYFLVFWLNKVICWCLFSLCQFFHGNCKSILPSWLLITSPKRRKTYRCLIWSSHSHRLMASLVCPSLSAEPLKPVHTAAHSPPKMLPTNIIKIVTSRKLLVSPLTMVIKLQHIL